MKLLRKYAIALCLAAALPLTACAAVNSATCFSQVTLTSNPQTLTVPFVFTNAADLLVLDSAASPPTTLTINSDYTVTGGNGSTGTISTIAGGAHAVQSGDVITITRKVPLTQTVAFSNTGPLTAAMIGQGLDKLTEVTQQLSLKLAGALQFQGDETQSGILGLTARKNTALGFDASGNIFFIPATIYNGNVVSSVASGAGLTASPNPIIATGTISQDFSYNGTYSGQNSFPGITLASSVPSPTTNKIYNDSGTLKWNGSLVGTVTSVASGAGLTGTVTGTGTISQDFTYSGQYTGANIFRATGAYVPLWAIGYSGEPTLNVQSLGATGSNYGATITGGSNASDYSIIGFNSSSVQSFRFDGAGQLHMPLYYSSAGVLMTDSSGSVLTPKTQIPGINSIEFTAYVPSPTTNKLYNNGGSLYWNGSAIGGGGSGTVTQVAVGNGLSASPSPVVTSGTISQNFGYSGTYTGINTFNANAGHVPVNINGYAGYESTIITNLGASGSDSFGLSIQAGTNNVDYGIKISDTVAALMFKVDGAGQLHLPKYYSSVGFLATDASGNVTVGSPAGAGTVTSVAAGNGLTASPSPIVGAGTLSQNFAYSGTYTGTNAFTANSGHVPITANGYAGSYAAVVNGSTATGNSFGLNVKAGTGSSDTAVYVTDSSSSPIEIVDGAGQLHMAKYYSSAGVLVTDASGNFTSASSITVNTSGTAANVSGTPALPNGTTATTQVAGDNSTKLATTAYVATANANTPVSLGNLTGTINIDWSAGQFFYGTLTGSTTFTFSNAAAGGWILVRVSQTGTNSYTVTWPSMSWPAATAPTMTAGSAAHDDTVVVYMNSVYDANSVQNLH